jgi:hypothetical protein
LNTLYQDIALVQLHPPKFDIKNIRKLPQFGYVNNNAGQFDFEWPLKSEDIQPTNDGTPVRIVAVHWKANPNSVNYLGPF